MHNSARPHFRSPKAVAALASVLLFGAGTAPGARAQIVKTNTATATVANLAKFLTVSPFSADGRESPGDLYIMGALTFSTNGPYVIEAKLSAPDPDDIRGRTPSNTYVSLNTATWLTIATGPGGVNQSITTRFFVVFAQNSPHSPGNATSSPIVYRINGGPPIAPPPTPPSILPSHIADIDRSAAFSGSSNWQATVDVLVYDNLNGPVLGAAVAGNFSSGGSGTCTTLANGRCTITSGNISTATASVTWTVTDITGSNVSYAPPNSDPDGDSNGTTVTITKPPAIPVHIADLDRSSANQGANNWRATVNILVVNASNAPVAGASVGGTFSGGGGSGSCTTAANGRCSITSGNIPKTTASVTWTVSTITGANMAYTPPNSDPDGDSNGTVITISKP